MRVLIFSILILSISNYLFAQVPGYQGKRLNVSYDFNFYHNVFKYLTKPLDGSYYSGEWTAPSPTIKNGLRAEYVLSRNSSILANASLFLSEIPNEHSFNSYYSYWGYTYSNDIMPIDETNMTAFSLGLHYRLYKATKGLAPLGSYFDVGLEKWAYKLKVSEELSESDLVTVENWYSAYMLSCGLGTQRAIYKNITLRLGLKSGWVFGKVFNMHYINNDELDGSNYFFYTSRDHLWKKNLLSVDIGVGYLIK